MLRPPEPEDCPAQRVGRAGLFLAAFVLQVIGSNAGATEAGFPGLACRQPVEAAARGSGVPPELLAAIGRVESGRRDPFSGATHPWPWAVNADGEGRLLESREHAIAHVRALQAQGIRSIDVGCMQVNLLHHPSAFASLDAAFDPVENVGYAARLLAQLRARSANWLGAAGLYHSATPWRGAAYEQRVALAWAAEGGPAAGTPDQAPMGMAAAVTTGTAERMPLLRDPTTVMMAPAAMQVRVFRPQAAMAIMVRPVLARLPQVFTLSALQPATTASAPRR